MRGGYIIVNLKGSALTSGEAANVPGTYAAVSNPYNKATMISGLTVGDVDYPDFYAPFVANAGTFTANVVINGKTISIEVAVGDDVTVTVSE